MMDKNADRLWAPWRSHYITGTHVDEGCIFCVKPRQQEDRENLILHRGEYAFVMMNLFPYNNGHLMVVPYQHTGDLEVLPAETSLEMMQLLQMGIRVMKRVFNPQGFNAGFNIGRAAGAGVETHVHLHLVPRWNGDTNFMPTLAGTKVVSEHILTTYDKLYEGFMGEVKK